jgi:hypothetical protein
MARIVEKCDRFSEPSLTSNFYFIFTFHGLIIPKEK